MIRTQIVPCKLNREICDSLNLASGRIYSGIVSRHWRLLKQKGLWLSEKSMRKLSDMRLANRDLPMHAHTIDAAQEGFPKACKTTRAIRKAGFPEANFPWRSKKFRTTIWKNTAIKFKAGNLELSTGSGNPKIVIALPDSLWSALKFLEVRLVFDKKSRRYEWHIVSENGIATKTATGPNTVSVDPGEIHPAVVGDDHESTIITCRERRHQMQGHAKRLAKLSRKLSSKKKGSRQHRRLVRAKSRMKAHHERVLTDMAHKISREIVNVAVERKASTIVYGDIKDIADEVALGKKTNQKISGWNHGKVRAYVEYKAEAEGIAVILQDERYTSQTCPSCGNRHKPRGRNYRCPSCGFQSHRDVVGQVNILSAYKFGAPGKIPAPTTVKHRTPYNIRVMRRRQDTAQVAIPVAQPSWAEAKQLSLFV
jgi:putative transposase